MFNPRQVQAIANWQPNYLYLPEMEVIANSVRYRCLVQHTSSSAFELDGNEKWEPELTGKIMQVQREPTGFPNRSATVIEFDEETRTFTISPTEDSFEYWIQGKRYEQFDEGNIVISDTEGPHFIFYDGDQLIDSTEPADLNLIFGVAYIAYLYWSSTQIAIVFGDERHGLTMDWATHAYIHHTFGTQFIAGLGLTNLSVDGNANEDAHAQFGVADGSIVDEDLIHEIIGGSPQTLQPLAQIPILYQWGASGKWLTKQADDFPIIYNGTAGYTGIRLPYNSFDGGIHGFTEVNNNDYVLVHIFATHDIRHPIIAVLGKNQYPRSGAARRAAAIEATEIVGLPFAESYLIATIIFQTATWYENIPKARIVSVDHDGSEYIDFRKKNIQHLSGVAAVGAGSWQVLQDENQIYWDVGRDDSAEITLEGDRNLKNPVNLTSGATYHLVVKQDNLGNRQLSFGSAYKFQNQTIPTLTSTPNGIDIIDFFSDGLVLYCKAFKNFG